MMPGKSFNRYGHFFWRIGIGGLVIQKKMVRAQCSEMIGRWAKWQKHQVSGAPGTFPLGP